MHTYRFILALALTLISCGNQPPVVEVTNHGWPDGTSILVVSDGRIAGRSRLYGDRARITVDSPGIYELRIAGRGYLSSSTSGFRLQPGITGVTLDPPVACRTIDGRSLGIGLHVPDVQTSLTDYLADTPLLTTILVPYGISGANLAEITTTAHDRLTAVSAQLTHHETIELREADVSAARLDSLALACVDGIVLTIDPDEFASISPLITLIHDRGMSLSVRIGTDAADDLTAPIAPGNKVPDELIIAATPVSSTGSLNPVDEYDRLLNSVWLRSFPRDRVVLSFSLSAMTPEGQPETGALVRALDETDGEGMLRLRDGSLRFGHRGTSYQFDDLESIRQKVERLGELGMRTTGGVYLEIDGRGIVPNQNGLRTINDLLRSW